MIRDREIKEGMKRLSGEIHTGRVYNTDGTPYVEPDHSWFYSNGAGGVVNTSDRPDNWRTGQSQKSIRDILRGK